VGGLVGGFIVVGVTILLKTMMDFVTGETAVLAIVIPLLGLLLTYLVLNGIGRSGRGSPWRTFPPGSVRSDISGDVVDTAGQEERFPWRLAPLRLLAIFATVGFGNAMGTEAPAAYLGVAVGAALGDRGQWWRKLLRPAALGGGAAGVAALMGIPLVGTAYILEMGWRNRAPINVERVLAAVIGGLVGWGIDVVFRLNLIRLITPTEPPRNLLQAVITALFIGLLSGAITAAAGWGIYRAKKWHIAPHQRLLLGGLATALIALTIAFLAEPIAAVGPGGGAILWAENTPAHPLTLLAVAVLRAAATTAAVAAGGCGGIFIPFIAVGDLAGRVFAPGLGVGSDLAGAAGAAGGIAGGYRLPFTALFMVLGVGGPRAATLTCLAADATAFLAGVGIVALLKRIKGFREPLPVH
jgi:H+/Cl- antiporter ClcA